MYIYSIMCIYICKNLKMFFREDVAYACLCATIFIICQDVTLTGYTNLIHWLPPALEEKLLHMWAPRDHAKRLDLEIVQRLGWGDSFQFCILLNALGAIPWLVLAWPPCLPSRRMTIWTKSAWYTRMPNIYVYMYIYIHVHDNLQKRQYTVHEYIKMAEW